MRTFPNVVGAGPVPQPIPCARCGKLLALGEGHAWRCSEWLRETTNGELGLPGECHCPETRVEGWHANCVDRTACTKRWEEAGRPPRKTVKLKAKPLAPKPPSSLEEPPESVEPGQISFCFGDEL